MMRDISDGAPSRAFRVSGPGRRTVALYGQTTPAGTRRYPIIDQFLWLKYPEYPDRRGLLLWIKNRHTRQEWSVWCEKCEPDDQ